MPGPIQRSNRALTTTAVLLTMFMSAMEATVIATAMPTVIADLRGLELYGWVGAIYMLATTVTIPAWGKLADVWGRKPVMLGGLVLFMAGSLGCGFSVSMPMLIAFRAVQGIGAGALQPITITIVGDIFTMEERARIQGIFGAVWGFSAMIGPVLGGLIIKALSWPWVFFINIPFGVLAGVLLVLFYKESGRDQERTAKPLDLLGMLTLSVAIVCLLLGAGGRSPEITLPVSIAAGYLFFKVENKAADPILSLAFLRRPIIQIGSILGALMGATMMVTVMYTPLYVQAVQRGTASQAGASVAPMLIGWPICSALSGRLLPRFSFQPLVRIGMSLVALGSIALYFTLDRGVWSLRAASFVMGSGMGLANTAVILAVQNSVGHKERGTATASTMFSRSIGGAVSVGAVGSMIAALLSGKVPEALFNDLLASDHKELDPTALEVYQPLLRAGIAPAFLVIVGLGVLTGLASMAFPKLAFVSKKVEAGDEDTGAPLQIGE